MGFHIGDLPDDRTLAKKVIEGQTAYETARMQQGWVGPAFGDVLNKPGNIAGFVIVTSFAMLLLLMLGPVTATLADKLMPVFTGLITLALGYMFGKSQR